MIKQKLTRRERRKENRLKLKEESKLNKLIDSNKSLIFSEEHEYGFLDTKDKILNDFSKNQSSNCRLILDELKTEDVALMYVRHNGLCLQYFRGQYQNVDIVLAAIFDKWESWYYVDNINKTYAVKKALITKWGEAISLLEPEEQTEELCLLALSNDKMSGCIDTPLYIKKSAQTEIIALEIIKKDLYYLPCISNDCLTNKVIREAIKLYKDKAILIIESSLISDENYKYYLDTGGSIKNIPIHRRSIFNAYCIKNIPYEIQFLEYKDRTEEICNQSMNLKPDSVRYVPDFFKSLSLFYSICLKSKQCMQYINNFDWFKEIKTKIL